MKSYVITQLDAFARLNEAWNLYRGHTRGVGENVRRMVEQVRQAETKISALLGRPIQDLSVLEIGPGQQLMQMAYLAARNEVVGIDLDVILQHLSLSGCIRMAKQNGWMRTCKTVGRKLAGIDNKVVTELQSQLGLKTMPQLRVLPMDASKMDFEDNRFDVVLSRAVFEHLPDPGAVASEIRRVLKPGGVMFLTLHLFSSDSGSHDTRIFVGQREQLPYWAHLRPEHVQDVRSNSYLNRLLLADWKRIFRSVMPGSEVAALCDAGEKDRQELRKLRLDGQLAAYSDEELLTPTVEISWRKPA
jgi:SAM-dependent methyltransferase